MSLEHFTGNLGVTWFVGADQAETSESVKEENRAARKDRQQFSGNLAARIFHRVTASFVRGRKSAHRLTAAQTVSRITNPTEKG